MKNFATVIPRWAWATFVVCNFLMAIASMLLQNYNMFALNMLSGLGCAIGFVTSGIKEDED